MERFFSAIRRHVNARSRLKSLCLAVLLGGAIIAPFAHQTTARASIPCRSDPIIVVNGALVSVVSTLEADSSAVREVDYQVTVPSAALIDKLTLTVGLGFPENVTYIFSPSQPWGSIQVTAAVVTQDGVAPFPVSVRVSSLLAGANTTSGASDSTLTVALDHVLML